MFSYLYHPVKWLLWKRMSLEARWSVCLWCLPRWHVLISCSLWHHLSKLISKPPFFFIIFFFLLSWILSWILYDFVIIVFQIFLIIFPFYNFFHFPTFFSFLLSCFHISYFLPLFLPLPSSFIMSPFHSIFHLIFLSPIFPPFLSLFSFIPSSLWPSFSIVVKH